MKDQEVILSTKDLCKWYPVKKSLFQEPKFIKAITGVTLQIRRGETLGIVGESGCGKTTLGRTLIRLLEPTSGQILFKGQDITSLPERALKPLRKDMQIIFQDPYSSLDPRMMVGQIIGEPFYLQKMYSRKERREKVKELMELCGLDRVYVNRYPHEFSGGQRQRIGIARALALNPQFMVCDEPVSALDVSIQSQIINLLMDLQEQRNLAYGFISHNLNVVHHIADRVLVMYLGRMMELAGKKDLYGEPAHPYTMALLKSIPKIDFSGQNAIKAQIRGDLPSPMDPPPGCVFHTRCRFVCGRCREELPQFREVAPGHFVACHRAEELAHSSAAS